MPNFDRTGPRGRGPKTGKKVGKCNNEDNNRNMKNIPRRRFRDRIRFQQEE